MKQLLQLAQGWFCLAANFNASKLFSFNRLREPFLSAISMADANFQYTDSLHPLRIKFSANMKRKDYIDNASFHKAFPLLSNYQIEGPRATQGRAVLNEDAIVCQLVIYADETIFTLVFIVSLIGSITLNCQLIPQK